MTISHMGLALVLMGVAGSLAWQTEYLQVMHPGDSAAVAGYDLKFIGVEDNVKGPNYLAARASFIVTKNGRYITELQPERRIFTNPPQPLSTVAIHTNLISDLYVVLGDPAENGGFVIRILHNPLVPLLFFGAVLMVLGGMVSLTDRRHRIGAPLRRIESAFGRRRNDAGQSKVSHCPASTRNLVRWGYRIPLIAFVMLTGFLIYRLYLVEEGFTPDLIPSVLIDRAAPAFDLPPLLPGMAGLKAGDFKGKVTLVNFFASWCAPCRVEHPMLPMIAKAGITLVGIDYKDRSEDAKAWLAELGDPYRTVAVDAQGRTGIEFGVYGVPETYLIDKQGIIRFKQTGPSDARDHRKSTDSHGEGIGEMKIRARWTSIWTGLILVAALWVGAGSAWAIGPNEMLSNPVLESRARAISRELRCLVCQNESIDNSEADLAHDLRVLVRQRIVAGDRDEQVKQYIVARYGTYVLLKPPLIAETYLLWFGPLLLLLCAAGTAFVFCRRSSLAVELAPLSEEQYRRLAELTGSKDRKSEDE